MSVVILYGTEMGNAELVADAVADTLRADHDVAVHDMSEFPVADLNTDDFAVIVCSTYGDGELPTGAEPFAEDLEEYKPDLTGLRFAVFGLGDIIYGDSFCRGGEIMAEMLVDLGAEQVGEHARHDYSSSVRPASLAAEWARSLVGLIAPVGAG